MELLDEITDYVDDELKDYPIKRRMGELINMDCSIQQGLLIHKTIKELLHKLFACCKIPFDLKDRILSEIFENNLN